MKKVTHFQHFFIKNPEPIVQAARELWDNGDKKEAKEIIRQRKYR